ncbi:MAG: hypothetical protein MJ252_10220 [archaeon]|nr:hypothetical protein [archaeon]
MKIPLIISLIVLNISITISYKQNGCVCPSTPPNPPEEIKDDPNFELKEVISSSGKNFGIPMLLEGFVFLPNATTVGYHHTVIPQDCPEGYRLPTKEEIDTLLSKLGNNVYDTLTDKNGLGLDPSLKYYTSTHDTSKSYYFWGLTLDNNTKTYKFESQACNTGPSRNSGRCVLETKNAKFNIEGKDYDLSVNKGKSFTLISDVIKGYLWRVDDKLYSTKEVSINTDRRGCHLMETWGKILTGDVLYNCDIIYSKYYFEMNSTSNFNLSYVETLNDTYNSKRKSAFHFGECQAPISPKANGGYYLTFYDKEEKKIRVLEYFNNDTVYKNTLLEYDAYPMDISETDYGFAIYAKYTSDLHHSFIVAYNYNYVKRFETTIMNNGADAKVFKEGIQFYNSSNVVIYGLSAMYDPDNGKLNYGRGYLTLIFAHYNYFGASSGGHTGDTYFIFDSTGNPQKAKYAWGWESSHSLIQSHIYDGKYFITAALGDAYPMGIKICVVDVTKNTSQFDQSRNTYPQVKYSYTDTMIPFIQGNMGGQSMGRLGGVLNFGNFYVCIYSIKQSANDTTDGIFLTKFKYENEKITEIGQHVTIKSGCAGSLTQLRAAKFGNRILITYILYKTDFGTGYPYDDEYKTETMYYLLIDTNGSIIKDSIQASTQEQALNEDLRELRDGTLRWAYIDTKDVLKIVKVNVDNKLDIEYFEDKIDDEEPPEEPKKDDKKEGGLSGGVIALIVILCIAAVGVGGFFLYTKVLGGTINIAGFSFGGNSGTGSSERMNSSSEMKDMRA